VFSTIWNRWCTARRFQIQHSSCLLGCNARAEDSIEHYCRCRCTSEFMARKLKLAPRIHANLHTFTLNNPHITTTQELTMVSLLIYTIYTATNHLRHTTFPPGACIQDALAQWAREGAKGHRNASTVMDNLRNPHQVTTPLPPIPNNT